MSWCGGGEIRPTPGVECRTRAMVASTLWPGNWPPSPGLAPCAILICIMSALTRYSVVTPKRPEATCLIADRTERHRACGEPLDDLLGRLDLVERHGLALLVFGALDLEQAAQGQ